MKYATRLRRAAPSVRNRRGTRTASAVVRATLPITGMLALVASALLTGVTFAAVMELLPTTIPTLMAGWVTAIGLTFALPMVAVRTIVAALERTG